MVVELEEVARAIRDDAYVFVQAPSMHAELGSLSDWPAFAASWNDLEEDTYLAERGCFRKRRYAVFEITADGTERQGHQPHRQHVEYNLTPVGEGRTRVRFDIILDLAAPVPAFLIRRAKKMVLDVATGEVSALDAEPRATPVSAGAPQWAANDTVLIQTPDGPVLLTMEPTA